MILYNTTFSVDDNIVLPFVDFIRDVFIPLAQESGLHSGLLTELRVTPEKNSITGENTRTFALQLRAPSQDALDEFRSDVLPELYRLASAQWGMGLAFFESTLDVIHDTNK